MRATAPGAGILFALPLIVSLLIPAGALAQLEPSASGLEFETNLSESSLQLSGRETITGLAPLEVPGPLTGEYWLTAEAPRVAPQRGRVTIDLDETGSRIVAYGRPTFRERFIQGLVFPGYAQYRYQDPGKASFFGTAAATGIGLSLWSQIDLRDAEDAASQAALAAGESGLSDDERHERENLARDAEEAEVFAGQRRNMFLAVTAATWGIGLVDALFFSPDFRVRNATESSLSLSLRQRSRGQAALRSAVFPGLGQAYNGQSLKAMFAAVGGAATVSYFLYEQDDYNRAVMERNQAQRRLENARTPQERAELRRIRNAARDEVDSQASDRNLAAAVTLGFWGASILDAIWSDREKAPKATSLSLATDPIGRTVAARLRF